jgi:hypothetical protein
MQMFFLLLDSDNEGTIERKEWATHFLRIYDRVVANTLIT